MQFLGFRTYIYLRKTNKQDIIYKQGKKLLFFQFQIRESKHVQFEEKGADNPYVYTGLDRKRSPLVKATVPTPAHPKPVRARTIRSRYRRMQTTFLCYSKQWADTISDFNLFQRKTRMFALRNFYRQFSGYSKTEITEGRNGFIENDFLGCAVKMCVCG